MRTEKSNFLLVSPGQLARLLLSGRPGVALCRQGDGAGMNLISTETKAAAIFREHRKSIREAADPVFMGESDSGL